MISKSFGKSRKMPSTAVLKVYLHFYRTERIFDSLAHHKWCLRCDKCHVKLFVITFWIFIRWRYFPWGFIFSILAMFSRYAKKEKKIDFNTKRFSKIRYVFWRLLIFLDILIWESVCLLIQNTDAAVLTSVTVVTKIILSILFYRVRKPFNFRGVYTLEGRIGGFALMCLHFPGLTGSTVDTPINISPAWESPYFVSLPGCTFRRFKT